MLLITSLCTRPKRPMERLATTPHILFLDLIGISELTPCRAFIAETSKRPRKSTRFVERLAWSRRPNRPSSGSLRVRTDCGGHAGKARRWKRALPAAKPLLNLSSYSRPDAGQANWVLDNGYADVMAFGRQFIAKPDLPRRLGPEPFACRVRCRHALWRRRARLHRLSYGARSGLTPRIATETQPSVRSEPARETHLRCTPQVKKGANNVHLQGFDCDDHRRLQGIRCGLCKR